VIVRPPSVVVLILVKVCTDVAPLCVNVSKRVSVVGTRRVVVTRNEHKLALNKLDSTQYRKPTEPSLYFCSGLRIKQGPGKTRDESFSRDDRSHSSEACGRD
jgi:hypothetical protein